MFVQLVRHSSHQNSVLSHTDNGDKDPLPEVVQSVTRIHFQSKRTATIHQSLNGVY